MELPEQVQNALGIGATITEQELIEAADACPLVTSTLGLSGREFADAVIDAATGAVITVTLPRRVNLNHWNYCEIANQGGVESWFLTTPNSAASLPATKIGKSLVSAWIQNPSVVNDGQVATGILIQSQMPGGVLTSFSGRFAAEWADACFLLDGIPNRPAWVTGNQINVVANARLNGPLARNQNYEQVFLRAIAEHRAHWRFLSLYRVFEHGYLSAIFQTLESTFFGSPKESLDTATKSVSNEIRQFVTLVGNASLTAGFEVFHDTFDHQKSSGNQLAIAIDRSIQQNDQQKLVQGKWQMGVLFAYKMRCSVVHAGLSAPVFDAYADGPALFEAMLPCFESSVLQFLGLVVT